MTINELINLQLFDLVNEGDETDRDISTIFCCDLLSIAMSRAPMGGAWFTVMGNMNTLAVASLTDTACIILAEGVQLDEIAAVKAESQGISVFKTDLPVFDAAVLLHKKINA